SGTRARGLPPPGRGPGADALAAAAAPAFGHDLLRGKCGWWGWREGFQLEQRHLEPRAHRRVGHAMLAARAVLAQRTEMLGGGIASIVIEAVHRVEARHVGHDGVADQL